MDDIPLLCLDLIVSKILDREGSHKLAKHAATMASVGNPTCTTIARILWEYIDPGCTVKARKLYEKKLVDWRSFAESSIPPVPTIVITMENKATEIKEICAALNCKRSGTKAEMLTSIQDKINNLTISRAEKIDSMKNRPKMPACYVTKTMRDIIIENRNKKIAATTAKKDYMLSEKDLGKLTCETMKNPHYRSGPLMRLYKWIDVIEASVKKHGDIRAAREKREARTAKTQATKSRPKAAS